MTAGEIASVLTGVGVLYTIATQWNKTRIDSRSGTFTEMQGIINNYKEQVKECQAESDRQEQKIAKLITDHEATVRTLAKERDDAIVRAVAAETQEHVQSRRADDAEHELTELRKEVQDLRIEVAELKDQLNRSRDSRTRKEDGSHE